MGAGGELRADPGHARGPAGGRRVSDLARTVEALLFLSPDPVAIADLAEATEATEGQVAEAIELLSEDLAEGKRGIILRVLGGGFTLASDPSAEEAARRLLAKPRTPPLTPAQAESLAIVAYLQPVSRPEI
ncbi:MAG: SMC-Scp complex subunit ScpB, partial [Actinobacteria bacterium]|nr:SMC-Scp complex subunit ScpB [Actinomycetota bacterium]